jgi:saccharopine dehydrogenase-like NADP-dependent oxidoreductase
MNILVIGAGGVGASIASIAETRQFFSHCYIADISLDRVKNAIEASRTVVFAKYTTEQ